MSVTIDGVRIVDMPDLGTVTDGSSVVGEHAGSGRFMATALRDYVLAAAAAIAPPNVGRNLIHNPMFRVNQRGNGPWTAAGYTADRWYNQFITTGGSCSVSVAAVSAASAASVDEAMTNVLQYINTAGTGGGDVSQLQQDIEGVRRISGKTVTVSFWAWAASGTPSIIVELIQVFGSGGSPSPNVSGIGATGVVINTVPTRYSVTINVPSASGKTFGTNAGTDFTALVFLLSSGSTGFQSGTFLFWGVQLEVGSVATQLEKLEYAEQWVDCARFYQVGQLTQYSGGAASGVFQTSIFFSTPMRATPTMTLYSTTLSNLPSISASGANIYGATVGGTATLAGETGFTTSYTASAEV
jgi:hypothetical protein